MLVCPPPLKSTPDITETNLNFKSMIKPGRVTFTKIVLDVPAGPRKSDYLYTNFLPNFPTINIPFSTEKHPILTKLGAFYNM